MHSSVYKLVYYVTFEELTVMFFVLLFKCMVLVVIGGISELQVKFINGELVPNPYISEDYAI